MKLPEALKTLGWQPKIINPKSRIDIRRSRNAPPCGALTGYAGANTPDRSHHVYLLKSLRIRSLLRRWRGRE